MDERRWTRAGLLRTAVAAGAVAAGGAALRAGDGTSLAAPSRNADAEILNLLLTIEQVQLAFYRKAVASGGLTGELRAFATTVAAQEGRHVAFIAERLGARAKPPPKTAFDGVLGTPERFRASAIALEEASIAAYIGQAANLTHALVGPIATLVSVEARQVAWARDLAGVSPAPRAADPARTGAAVMADLRRMGFVA